MPERGKSKRNGAGIEGVRVGSSADTSADVSAEALAKAEALARVGHKRRKGSLPRTGRAWRL